MLQYWIEVIDGEGGYFWRLVAANGETLCHSQTYHSKWNARRAAKRLHKITGLPWCDELREP